MKRDALVSFINDCWKPAVLIFSAGSFVAGVGYLGLQVEQLRAEIGAIRSAMNAQQQVDDRAHYFIAQRVAKDSGPLSLEDMETLGLLGARVNGDTSP